MQLLALTLLLQLQCPVLQEALCIAWLWRATFTPLYTTLLHTGRCIACPPHCTATDASTMCGRVLEADSAR